MFTVIKFTLQKVRQSGPTIFYGFVFLSVFYSILSFLTTLIFKEIVDTASGTQTILHLDIWGILIFQAGFQVFASIISGLRDYLLPILKGRVSMLFLGEIIDKTAKLDIASLENPQKVGVISRAYNRIHFQFEYYFRSIVNLFTTFIEVVLALVIFTIASPVGTVILIIANLINTIVKAILGGTNLNIYKANYETRLKFGYTTGLITQRETLLELKLFQNFKYVKNKILSIFNAFISKEISHEKRNQIIGNLVGIIPIVASFSFTLILAGQLQSNQISVGTFVFLFTNMLIFAGSLGRLSTTFVSIVAESDSIKDIIEFYELKPHLKYIQVKDQYDLNNWFEKLEKPEIYVQNVSFKYPNASTNALTNVSLKIPYSQNLALIGENGAGKSTLIKLILRVYDPDQGKITINDIDVKNIPIDVLYHLFGTLFQNFGKFNLTAKENLEIAANKKLSDEEMIGYLKYSNAWKFIESTKGKLNQQLGPEYSDGIDLSGGQWQSLAIARAYAKQAPIVILDEPTSAIDAKSEMEIFDRLNKK